MTGKTQADMGLSSVASILGEISKNTIIGNNILRNIQKSFEDMSSVMGKSVGSMMNKKWLSQNAGYQNKSLKTLVQIKSSLISLNAYFRRQSYKEKLEKKKQPSVAKAAVQVKQEKIKADKPDKSTVKVLKELNEFLKANRIQEKATLDYKGLFGLVNLMVRNFNNKLYKKMDKFAEGLAKILDFGDKTEKFNKTITDLTTLLNNLSKTINPVSKSLFLLSGAFFLLGLSFINPALLIGLGVISGFIFIISKLMGGKDLPKNLVSFSLGIGVLTLAIIAMSFVDTTSIFKMLAFIVGLGFALKSHSKANLPENLTKFAMGIGILTLALVAFAFIPISAILGMLLFVGGLGLALRTFSGRKDETPLWKFALGLGLVVLAMYAMKDLPNQVLINTVLFIAGLGLATRMFSEKTSLMKIAFGIGLIILSMYALSFIPTLLMIKFVGFIAALGLALRIYSEKSGKTMLYIGIGLLALSVGLLEFKKSNFTYKDILILSGTIMALGLSLEFIGKLKNIRKGTLTLFLMGFGMMSFGLALKVISSLKYDLDNIVVFGLSVGLIALVFEAIGGIGLAAIGGAITVGIMSMSALFAGLVLFAISKIKIDFPNLLRIMGGIAILTIGFALIAVPAVLGAIGALLFLPIVKAALIGALVLWGISQLTINFTNILSFVLGAGILSLGFALISPFALVGAIGALAFLPIAYSALLGALVLWGISMISFNEKNIISFINGAIILAIGFAVITPFAVVGALGALTFFPIATSALVGALVLFAISLLDFSVLNIASFVGSALLLSMGFALLTPFALVGALGAVLFLPIVVSALLGALTLWAISNMAFNETNIINFVNSMSWLTLGFALIAIPAVPGAVGALLFLPIVVAALLGALTLFAISKVLIDETKITTFVNSLWTLTWTFTKLAIPAVPAAAGALLMLPVVSVALKAAQALKAISDVKIDDKMIETFGKSLRSLITNFSNISTIDAGVGAANAKLMEPIVNVSLQMATLFQKLQTLDAMKAGGALLVMTNVLTQVMDKLETWKNDNASTSIKNIGDFVTSFKGLDSAPFKSITDTMSKFLNSLSDDKKWDSINKHLTVLKNQTKDIVANINMLNLEKAIMLEKNLKLLSSKDSNTTLQQVIEKLAEMIDLLRQKVSGPQHQETSTPSIVQTPSQQNGFGLGGLDLTKKPQPIAGQQQLFDPHDNGSTSEFTNLLDALEAAVLKVQVVNQDGSNYVFGKQ